jgi:CMP-N-acetylneuraminic acid synthetase
MTLEKTAYLVAKGYNQRLPQKNMLPFGSSTLLGHKIQQLKDCKSIDRIVVGSDTDEILDHAKQFDIETFRQEPKFCDGSVSMNETIRNVCEVAPTDIVIWTHCTNPLVGSDHYEGAIAAYLNSNNDSLVSVSRICSHIWYHQAPLNFKPLTTHVVAADLEPVFHQDGAIFIQPYQQILESGYYYGDNPLLYELDFWESIDINNLCDYEAALRLSHDSSS